MKKHSHRWIECPEQIVAVYPLKKNTAGIMEVKVNSPAFICTVEKCLAKAIKSPWTGIIVEVEPA